MGFKSCSTIIIVIHFEQGWVDYIIFLCETDNLQLDWTDVNLWFLSQLFWGKLFLFYPIILKLFKDMKLYSKATWIKEWAGCFRKCLWVFFQREWETAWANGIRLMFDVAFKVVVEVLVLTLFAGFLSEAGPCFFDKSPSSVFH